MSLQNGILSMDPDKYREIDGVVFDLDSFARHCQPLPEAAPEEAPAPAPVFAEDPRHDGWYPAEDGQPPVPIMAGAVPPGETHEVTEDGTVTITRTVWRGGSGSGSGSYTTSYRTSYRTSGSGSYRFGSGVFTVGGYGLELV